MLGETHDRLLAGAAIMDLGNLLYLPNNHLCHGTICMTCKHKCDLE